MSRLPFEREKYSVISGEISTVHYVMMLGNRGATCEDFKVATGNLNQQEKHLLNLPMEKLCSRSANSDANILSGYESTVCTKCDPLSNNQCALIPALFCSTADVIR